MGDHASVVLNQGAEAASKDPEGFRNVVARGEYQREGETMSQEEIYSRLKDCILNGEGERIVRETEAGLSENILPMEMIEKMTDIMREVGRKFEDGEFFLPEMVKAADAWEKAVEVLEPEIAPEEMEQKKVGRMVIGTVQSDIHDLGKNIVTAFFRTIGFEIMDLGVDVPPSRFIGAAEEFQADIIGMSSLLTTSMPYQKSVVEHLEARKLRDRYKVIVGGGPVNQAWADEIGADGYARDAAEASRISLSLIGSY